MPAPFNPSPPRMVLSRTHREGRQPHSPTDAGSSPHRFFLDEFQPPNFYAERRHLRTKRGSDGDATKESSAPDWRMRERLKTVSVVLVLCLNIGVDPPDLVKTNPSAKLECWVDPFSLPAGKALETIGRSLQNQYEVLQPRARYRLSLDPSVEETKKLCCSLRRNAKEERILFHYNGHGVPKPTPGGELWVFNKTYTQYIPISIYDVQTWIGSPCVYVYDCSNAGNILHAFNRFAAQRDAETATEARASTQKDHPDHDKEPHIPMEACIQLAACQANEVLPMNPDLPADVFTSCLTTPLEIALRWAVTQNPLLSSISPEMIMKIPGRLNDRRTPLGELNWIFTAITDTIAWTSLPHDLFKRLYRQDLMVAALFRNFLLSERIMRYYGCTPVSSPALPATYQHPMWQSWDLAADFCVAQLPALLAEEGDGPPVEYQHSTFFAEQLTAFDVWLSKSLTAENPPEQLPIVLQVLLSQIHRLRAMMLLSRFLDIGPWAVNLALLVGIFPYVLKLLQSPAPELKPLLVFVWTKILVVDRSCQTDLLKDNGFMYFIKILASHSALPMVPNPSGLRAMCAFILSVFCENFPIGQSACLKGELVPALIDHLAEEDPLLRQWSCIALGRVWDGFPDGKWAAVEQKLHEKMCRMLRDPVPDVRAAALYALRCLTGDLPRTDHVITLEVHVANAILSMITDASPLVRTELVRALAKFVHEYTDNFVAIATEMAQEQSRNPPTSSDDAHIPGSVTGASDRLNNLPLIDAASQTSTQSYIWKAILALSVDSFSDVADVATIVLDYVMAHVVTKLHPPSVPQKTVYADLAGSAVERISLQSNAGEAKPRQVSVELPAPVGASTKRESAPNGVSNGGSSGAPSPDLVNDAAGRKKKGLMANIDTEVFFEWSCTFFAEPQMQTPDADDPGSVRFIERQWRRGRNKELSSHTLSTPRYLGTETLQEHVRLTFQGAIASKIAFHSFENHLATSDGHHEIRIYDYAEETQMQCFDNGNPAGSRVTYLRFVNENDLTLVAAGSDDGVMQLYNKHDDPGHIKRISAWRALPELNVTKGGAGMVADWHQASGLFLCAGDAKLIRVWDANKEICVQTLPTKNLKSVTCMTTDRAEGNMVFAGFADGTVQIYDRREPPLTSVVRTYKEHPSRVLAIRQVESSAGQDGSSAVISGCGTGDIRVWDLRLHESVRHMDMSPGRNITAFDVHPVAPVFACGNESGIRIADWNHNLLGTTRYSEGFLAQRMGSVNCVAFHPHRLAIAATSSLSPWISIYALNNDHPHTLDI
ncbi:raptor N-terminal caspase like domain-containing protein [Powellomyces hirtus]|nr:raptor N-terminal caspase like domain-containing protein [Powellomyces hirtus]